MNSNGRLMRLIRSIFIIALGVLGAVGPRPSAAQDGSLAAIFQKYNLLGTFAWDCSKPPSAQNNWYVHRMLDANHVQRDRMTGPTTRQFVIIIDRAAPLSANEIELSGTITGRVGSQDLDGAPTAGVWRVEQGRLLPWEATVNGNKLVTNGRLTSTGLEVPWNTRCGG